MSRDAVSIDDIVKNAKAEVNVLKTQKATLTVNLSELEDKRNNLSQEILDFTNKLAEIKKTAKDEADSIIKSAQEKLNKANSKEAEASVKVADLNEKLKETNNLIKSNQGLQKNLAQGDYDLKNKISQLEGLVALIEETLKNIK